MDLIKVAEEAFATVKLLKKHLQPARSSQSSRLVTLSLSLTKLSRVQKSVSSSTVA